MRHSLISLVLVGATVLIGCEPNGPVDVTNNVPHVGAGVGMDTTDWVQSETATVSGSAFLFPILVTGFNDYSISTISPPEFDFTVMPFIIRRGASEMGWSTSGDVNATWQYNGKLRPPTATPGQNNGWSYIGSDPSMAVDPTSTNLVYYVHLGVSDATWNAISGGADTVLYTLFYGEGEPIDGLCVAQSTDGGLTFATPACFAPPSDSTPPDPEGERYDRTGVTVDGMGRVYITTRDVSAQQDTTTRLRVFAQTTIGHLMTFTDISPASAFFPEGVFQPRLRTDGNGDVWLAALVEGNGNGVLLSKHAATDPLTSSAWTATINASTACSGPPGSPLTEPDNPSPIANTLLREEHSYDFDVGVDENDVPVVGLAFQLQRGDGTRYIQGGRLTTPILGPPTAKLGCLVDSDLSTNGILALK